MNAHFLLDPTAVEIVSATTKQSILELLAQRFAASYGLDAANVLDRLQERENLGSTGFGRGVAIPHARVEGLRRPVAALLRLEEPVDFAAADGLPVDLVIGLVSPEHSGVGHLHALAAISRLVRDERVHDALTEAPDVEAMYGLIANAADRDAA
jgi:PTS system nitrogen regulatory IIA component